MDDHSTVANGATFFVTDADGRVSQPHDGFYHRDTRHLDQYEVLTEDWELEPLANVAVRPGERVLHLGGPLKGGARDCHIRRHQVVTDGLFEKVIVSNLTNSHVEKTLSIAVSAGFDDIFEVRSHAPRRAREITVKKNANPTIKASNTATETNEVRFSYHPSDVEFRRMTTVSTDRGTIVDASDEEQPSATVRIPFSLSPQESQAVAIATTTGESTEPRQAFERATEALDEREQVWKTSINPPTVPEHDGWNTVLAESMRNLLELRLETDFGPVPMAGIPWFATEFGRDPLIAAYQALPLTTTLAEGTCRYLAAHQATAADEYRAAEPGKILHEYRHGELAAREEVPHSPYYGTIDATALFVVLVHETWRWTGDNEFVRDLWENIEDALEWLDTYGDRNNDGFVEYPTNGADGGLTHQAWKDSGDGIMHPDGTHPSGPIAVAEAQGYYYDAKRRAANLASEVFGDSKHAHDLNAEATQLADEFERTFWLDDESFYAVALDGDAEPVRAVTTNPGHCLWSGLISDERANAVVDRLVSDDMFTGWGIRTLSSEHSVFNPQSYHLGSVWPHDTSLVALGMARYGRNEAAERVATGLIDAASARSNNRLPELFAGFDRSFTSVPIEYGVACEPQAWAAAAPLACLRAIQGPSTGFDS